MMMGFFRSENGRPDVNLPMGGAGTGNTFLDALTDDTAVFGTAVGDQAGLYLSTDRGDPLRPAGRHAGGVHELRARP